MAATEFATGDAETVKRWSNSLAREALQKADFKKFAGKSDNSIIQIHADLESQPGDTIKYDVLYQNRGDGVQGDTTLEGYEDALDFYQDEVKIDQLRHAHNFRKMTQQRTVHDLRKLARSSLAEWYAWKYDTLMYAYLAGVAGDSTESAVGTLNGALGVDGFAGNSLQVPDAAHHLNKTGSTMDLAFIDTLVTWAKTTNPRLRPVNVMGAKKFVLVLHPYQVNNLRIQTGDRAWQMIHARVAENGTKNPIYTGALGEYNGVVIHESEYIPRCDTAGAWSGGAINDNAAVFLGAQAGSFAMGNAYDKSSRANTGGGSYFKWVEQEKDYKNNKGIGVASCFGITKNRFNSADFGVIRLTTTDARPS
jgi:N4-gp56 family major capsid protein